ncbi:MAG TPA: hypothetical protein VII99_10470 [Bacteroidia bacterium]
MLNIRQIIIQLPENDFEKLALLLKGNKGEKFHLLFSLMRENGLSEAEIMRQLKVNESAYYTLKSRLHSKLQDFFAKNVPDTEIDLLKNIANIPHALFNQPRATAIAHLKKMEDELLNNDLPFGLTSVYGALKKIYRYSPKYFEYAQQYNKHLAYTIALDKVEELLSDFCKTLGEYILSRNKEHLDVLLMIKKEMHNHAHLYESHHLSVYESILNVLFALYVPLSAENNSDEPIDDILSKIEKTLKKYPKDTLYLSLKNVIQFLWFEYYHDLKIHKKAETYYNEVNKILPSFLLYNFCCVPSLFLISKINRELSNGTSEKLLDDYKRISSSYIADQLDAPNYINYQKFNAVAAFCAGNYEEAIIVLNDLLNTISFLPFCHAEIEIKLFLAVCYSFVNKTDLGFYMVKNIQRKLRDMKDDSYENALVFSKLLAVQLDYSHKKRVEKMLELRKQFLLLNTNENRMLEFILLDDSFMKKFTRI